MKERPILFSAPMVLALLNGSKTQTRRVAKLTANGHVKEQGGNRRWHPADLDAGLACPYGQRGDRLWVRETFAEGIHQMADVNHWAYAADQFGTRQRLGDRWKPSIHMPRVASRLTLEITGVRVERLQDISEGDARAEGANPIPDPCYHVRHACAEIACSGPMPYSVGFASLWQNINGLTSWAENPWVWVVEFEHL